MAFDSPYESEAAKPPISLHPAFPAIVSLWFAILLGFGSLVLPAVLFERIVAGSGIAALLPAAGPPLGFTARGMIAIAAALLGAALGVAIARRVAQAHSPELETLVKQAGGSRPPLRVKDELGGEGVVDGESLPFSRRRAIAVSEDDRSSDFLYQAPLNGEDLDALAPFAAAPLVRIVADDDPLELRGHAEIGARPGCAETPPPGDFAKSELEEDAEMTDNPNSPPASQLRHPADASTASNDRGSPRRREPLTFSAPSLARQTPEPRSPAGPTAPLAAAADADVPAAEARRPRVDWETAPLEGLGLVQLVQRLGSTIERRRERTAHEASRAAVTASHPALEDFEAAPAEEAALAMATYFGSASPVEADEPATPPAEKPVEAAPVRDEIEPESGPIPRLRFLQSFGDDDEDGDCDLVPEFSLPLRRPAAAISSFSLADNDAGNEDADDVEEADGEREGGYSSLLGMRNPFAGPKNEFVRIEDPDEVAGPTEPAVQSLSQEQPAGFVDGTSTVVAGLGPADTDAALRRALATLQKMSEAG